jgi:hypothetical protein
LDIATSESTLNRQDDDKNYTEEPQNRTIDILSKEDSVHHLMVLQKPLKMTIGQLSLAYNQAVIPLNVAEWGFLRLRHHMIPYLKKAISLGLQIMRIP